MTNISWLIALLVLIIDVVAIFVNKLDPVVGGLVGGLAVSILVQHYVTTTVTRRVA